MRILVTGASGFIAKNLIAHLKCLNHKVYCLSHNENFINLDFDIKKIDFIFHFSGVNRPKSLIGFQTGNTQYTEELCSYLNEKKANAPILFTSSIQVKFENRYGESKLAAEKILKKYAKENNIPLYIYRLPNVFGKWSKPNYNSVIATYCFNIINDIPIKINNKSQILNLIYIDDLVNDFISLIKIKPKSLIKTIFPYSYNITLNDLAIKIKSFKANHDSGYVESVANGLNRALFATYLSFLDTSDFSYSINNNSDDRGYFVEFLKTKDSGQISFFTIRPGKTRGNHFHHTKNERFLLLKGKCKFAFENIISGDKHEIITDDKKLIVVQSIPGWSHNITNITTDDIIVMLWSNEIFDKNNPDTYGSLIK